MAQMTMGRFTNLVAGHAKNAVRAGHVVEQFSRHKMEDGQVRTFHRITIGASSIDAAHALADKINTALHEGKAEFDEYGRPYAAFHKKGVDFLIRRHEDPEKPRIDLIVTDVVRPLTGYGPGEMPKSDTREFPRDYQDTNQARLKIVRKIQDAAHG